MSNLYILSDLHIDRMRNPDTFFQPSPEALAVADIIVLAGDIADGDEDTPEKCGPAIRWARNSFPGKPIVMVLGNQEFYGQEFAQLDAYREDARRLDVHLLERDEVIVNGIRFLGCTLWTDMRIAAPSLASLEVSMEAVESGVQDYGAIYRLEDDLDNPGQRKRRPLTALDTTQEFHRNHRWLLEALRTRHDGKTVVLTHHAPSPASIPDSLRGDPFNPARASNLQWLMSQAQGRSSFERSHIDLWVHGHIHAKSDYQIGSTRIICNPKGYPGEDTGFSEWICRI